LSSQRFDRACFLALRQALGGILVAVTIKYADNILRGFAQSLALIVGAIGSWLLFDLHLSASIIGGIALVISAVRVPQSEQHARVSALSAFALASQPCPGVRQLGLGARHDQ
tara:strand:+ start:158 stop:493 length:336 start_codon:yes stop_codon:yes gene_type:complete